MRNIHPENRMLKVIAAGRTPIGTFNYFRDSSAVEIIAEAGMDYVIIDTEHAVMGRETVEQQIIAAQLNNITPLVRVGKIDPPEIRSYLECGAQGILVPHICSAADCRRAQDAMRYPPEGHASTCRSNRSTAFRGSNWLDYLDWVKQAPLIAMIEDPEGVENLEEIIGELKSGRDMIMFGKADYTQSIGAFDRSGSVDSPAVGEAGKKIARACREHGICFMVVPPSYNAEGFRKAAEDCGSAAMCIGVDQNILLDAYSRIVREGK